MQYDTQSGRHSKYSLQYHLIFCTKYRENLLDKEISDDVKEIIDNLAKKRGIKILNKETDKDHIHILFRATPTTELSKTINVIKGVTARKLRQKHKELREMKSLWSPTYFLATTGEVTLDQLKRYVEEQEDEGD